MEYHLQTGSTVDQRKPRMNAGLHAYSMLYFTLSISAPTPRSFSSIFS